MLRKLLKYDMREIFRNWWIVAASMAVVAILSGICMRFGLILDDNQGESDIIAFLSFGLVMLALILFFAGIGVGVFCQLLVYFRAYKGLYSDEGYLTFMLPLKRRALFDEKLLMMSIWGIINELTMTVSYAITVLLACSGISDAGNIFAKAYIEAYKMMFSAISSETSLDFQTLSPWVVVAFGLFVVISVVASSAIILLSFTVGAVIAKKYKLLAGVGVYYVIASIIGTIAGLTVLVSTVILLVNESEIDALLVNVLPIIIFSTIGIIYIVAGIIARAVSIRLLNKKLNLTA